MKPALDLQKLIIMIKAKLIAEDIELDDYDKAIKCLSQCVQSKLCIEIYEQYISY